LSEEGLVILLHQASHHEAEENEERPDGKKGAVEPRIKEWAGESTDEEQEVTLYGTNPGNCRRCMRTKEMGFIKPLVCTERVDDPPEMMAVNTGLDQ